MVGRTFGGLELELGLHETAYRLGIMEENSKVADLGTVKTDSNAIVFEMAASVSKPVSKVVQEETKNYCPMPKRISPKRLVRSFLGWVSKLFNLFINCISKPLP